MTAKGMVHVDHIIEVARGGAFDDPHNLQVLCKYHHRAKTNQVEAETPTPTSPNA
jgi:5-methylcytosine-specific restriction endonuclease McrA